MSEAVRDVPRPRSDRLSVGTLQQVAPLLDCVSERAGWNHCIDIVSRLTDADVAVALEFLSDNRAIVRSASARIDLTPGTTFSVPPHSQVGYMLDVDDVLISNDLRHEDRFVPESVLLDIGVASSMGVRFELPGDQLALVSVHSMHPDHFGTADADALLALRPMFSTALSRMRTWDAVELNARIDPLTGLMNRTSIMQELADRFSTASDITTLFIDLDGFKSVNDQLGHRAGDAVLRTVADRIARTLGSDHRLGRLGGDEFLLVVDQVDGLYLAERLLGHVEEVILVDSQVIQLSASIGIARRRSHEDATSMLERADRLMFQAKSAGRGAVRLDTIEDPAPPIPTDHAEPELASLASVRSAIAGLRIVVQPIVDAATHRLHGVEALTRGPIGHELERPDMLFTAAAKFGLLGELELAAKKLAFDLPLDDAVELFINLEPALLSDEDWLTALTDAWSESGQKPSVTAEVTERAVLHSPGRLLRSVEVCRELGWMIALDDVGSRSESLAALRWIDPDVVKLDMSLITNENPAHSAHVVAAIAAYRDMERHGDVMVIAEGVETLEDAKHADVLGADLLQGYLFGRPSELKDLQVVDVDGAPLAYGNANRWDGRRIATKRELLDLSRHVEASVVSSDCVLVATVQHVENVSPRTRRQYEGLARRCGFVGMIGVDMSKIPGASFHGVRTADLELDDPLRMEWQVLALSPTAALGLVATQLSPLDDPGDTPDMERLFSYRLITDDGDVEAAVRNLLRYF